MDSKTPRSSSNTTDPGCEDERGNARKDDPVTTVVKPIDRKVPEGPDNLRDRERDFQRKHGHTKDDR